MKTRHTVVADDYSYTLFLVPLLMLKILSFLFKRLSILIIQFWVYLRDRLVIWLLVLALIIVYCLVVVMVERTPIRDYYMRQWHPCCQSCRGRRPSKHRLRTLPIVLRS